MTSQEKQLIGDLMMSIRANAGFPLPSSVYRCNDCGTMILTGAENERFAQEMVTAHWDRYHKNGNLAPKLISEPESVHVFLHESEFELLKPILDSAHALYRSVCDFLIDGLENEWDENIPSEFVKSLEDSALRYQDERDFVSIAVRADLS